MCKVFSIVFVPIKSIIQSFFLSTTTINIDFILLLSFCGREKRMERNSLVIY